jgi:hypothetical protein
MAGPFRNLLTYAAPTIVPPAYWGCLLNFAHLQRLVDRQVGITNWRAGVRGCVVCSRREVITGTLYRVRITVSFRTRHAHSARSEEFVHRFAMTVDTDASTLGLCYLQQVHPHPGDADCLRRSSSFRRGGHFLEIKKIDTPQKTDSDQQRDENLHTEIVEREGVGCNPGVRRRAEGNNSPLCSNAQEGLCWTYKCLRTPFLGAISLFAQVYK